LLASPGQLVSHLEQVLRSVPTDSGEGAADGAAVQLLERLLGLHISLPADLGRARNLESVARRLRTALGAETASIFLTGPSTRVIDPRKPPLPEPVAAIEAVARESRALITHPAMGVNSLVCVPMVAGDSDFGCLTVVGPAKLLGARSVLLSLHVLASAVAARLELAHSRREQALALRDMRAVADSARGVVAGHGLEQVIHGLLRAATRHVPAAAAAVLFLSEEQSQPWLPRAQSGDPALCAAITAGWSDRLTSVVGSSLSPVLLAGPAAVKGVGSLAAAPLRTGSRAIGALVLTPATQASFSERDLRVLATVTDQGALAVENARLQSQAQRADEITVLYRLGRALNSSLDLRQTVSTTLESARSLTAAASAEVRLTTDDGASLEGVVGLEDPPDSSPGDRYRMSVLFPQTILGTRRPLLIPDVRTSSPTDDFSEREPASWLGSYLGVPLVTGERVIGVLSLGSDRPGAFSAEDLRLLEIVASQAATALSNARLYQETVRSLREAEAVAAVSRSVAASLDQRTVLQAVTTSLVDSMPLARYSFSYLVGQSGAPSLSALAPPEAEELGEPDAGIWQWCADGCLVRGEPVVVDDTLRLGFPSHSVGTAHSVVAVPMVAAGKTVGVIGVDSILPNAFTAGDLRLIRTMADQAATAVESAILYRDLEKAYQDLRQSTQTLTAVFDGITDGMYIVDRNDTIVAINEPEARFLRARRDALIGAVYSDWYHSSEGQCEHCVVQTAIERGEHVSTILCYVDHGQGPVWREVDAYPIRDEEGVARRVVVFARDVTERRRLEASLAESGRMASVGQLASSVAHEVNNPLTVIIGNTEILLLDMAPDDPNAETLAMILRAANRAARTVRNLLDLSGPADDELAEVDVSETIQDALQLLAHPLQKAGIEVVIDLSEDMPPVPGSSNRLKTVWMSLILNARDAIRASQGNLSRVTIRAGVGHDGSEVYVSISDTGMGIDPAERNRLFQPFYTTKPAGEALGLGLYGAYSVVRDHGGRIEVESPPGAGATFTVFLPLDPPGEVGDS